MSLGSAIVGGCRVIARKGRTWRRLSRAERGVLAQALLLLPLVDVALRLAPLRSVQRLLPRRGAQPTHAIPAARIGRLVDAAARHSPAGSCLRRSLVLAWLLRRRGFESTLRIGVRRAPSTQVLEAHAWVECDGTVVTDRAAGRDYVPLATLPDVR